ncbi:MAG: TraB/GumN family protein, partial [Epsilonproteobacteria bacterium]|nr:TraB/GumN family protein [Campylobacterota bacterium]
RIDKIVSKNPNKAYLFAFGIMHFLGQKSVIELLQSKGYNVVNKKFTIGYQKDEKRD